MTGFQIMQQGGDGYLLVGLELSIPINGEVHHRQEGVGVHMIVLTGLAYRLVAESQADAEAAQRLQQVVIITDERHHLIVWLV